jgi:ATP-dependent Lon protease
MSADDLNCDPEQECNPIIKEIIKHQNRHLVICISGIEYSHSDIIKRIAFNNEKIIDHYISDEVEFDLSSVQFVCCVDEKWTNQKSSLEIDSVEFIKDYANWGYVFEIFGYSEKEKIEIAKKSLIPSIKKEFGIPAKIAITDQAILKILRNYTIESGVNQLNSYLKIIARNINQLRDDKKQVKSKAVERILGAPHKIPFSANCGSTPVGSARFVYGSENGGGVDVVDAIVYETTGEEKLIVTGLIEDDTRQSIDLAISLFKKMIRELVGYDPKLNIHISFGSNELTGPSAGCSILLAIISSYFDIPVIPSVISTGEVLLRGSVRAVGCIREKVLSAVKHQNEVFIMPKQSESDLAYVPKEYLRMIKVVTISDIYELVQAAFGISVNDLTHV